MQIHGRVSSCVGPVIDVQLSQVCRRKENIILPILGAKAFELLPSVYDSILIVSPKVNFRDGVDIENLASGQFAEYFAEIPFSASIYLAVAHLLDVEVEIKELNQFIDPLSVKIEPIWSSKLEEHVLLSFAAIFLVSRLYDNLLHAEVSQICYGGVSRAIALATSDGVSTSSSGFILNYQPLIFQVGFVSLGRILNVTGAMLDPYIDLVIEYLFQYNSAAFSNNSKREAELIQIQRESPELMPP